MIESKLWFKIILYPNQTIQRYDFLNIDFKRNDLKEREYVNFYKVGITLPLITRNAFYK